MAAVVLANAFFLAFNVLGMSLPVQRTTGKVSDAFQQGQLEFRDFRSFDRRLGFNQYNDCSIVLMGLDRDQDVLRRALGPRLLLRVEEYSGFCRTLYEVVQGDPVAAGYPAVNYTRYWHGYVPLTMTMLQLFSIEDLRRVLKLTVAGSLLLLLFASWRRSPELRLLAASVAVVGLLFWALPYFGQSPSHSPGDSFVMAGLACLLFWSERLTAPRLLVPFCALYGAGVTYLEFLTGQLPVAAGLLLPTIYIAAVTRAGGREELAQAWRLAAAGLLAFGAGAVLTVLIKQGFVLAVFGVDSWHTFTSILARWAGVSSAGVRHPPPDDRLITPIIALLKSRRWLTYGSSTAATLLLGFTTAAWLGAAWMAARRPTARRLSDLLACLAGSAILLVWIFLLPTHTLIHTAWMVRILIVPIALGWAALLWQIRLRVSLGTWR